MPDAIEYQHFPTQVGYDDELQSGRDSDEDDVQKFFGCVNRLLQQLSGWLVSDDLGGEDAECVGPELVWLHVICDCEAGWMYCQIHIWNVTFYDCQM